jgi:CheY-like chemotaxis protein
LAVGHIVFRVTFCENSKQKEPDQRILLVDDSKAIRGVLSKALKDAGYQVEEAADGRMALDKHQAFQPHLTIMDINMPDMNGLEVITKIRKADREARFVMLTSSSRKDEVLTAKNLNVRKYLIKPVEIGSFLQVVREALQ